MIRHTHCVAVAAFLVATPVLASTDISIYSDTAGDVNCVSAEDNQFVTAYVVATGTDALSAVSFRANVPPRLLWIGDIEVFYNRRRRHSHIGRISPAEFERRKDGA